MSISAGFTAEEIREFVHEYQVQPQGQKGPVPHVGRARADHIEQDYLTSPSFGSTEQVVERLAERERHGTAYAIHYFPEAAYDRSSIELFEREVIGALA